MKFSYSALSTLQTCERKYGYRYLLNYESDKPQNAASLRGNAWHAVVQSELIRAGVARETLLVIPEELHILDGLAPRLLVESGVAMIEHPRKGWIECLPESVIEIIGYWWEGQESDRRDELAEAYGDRLDARLSDLWLRYLDRWGDEEHITPLLVETRWVRAAPNGRELMGYVDAVVRDEELRLIVVRDYKTHDSWPSEPDHVLDLMDSQLHLQAWGVAPLLKEHKLKPQAVEYDRARFKKPATPQLTQAGALSKSVTDFDARTYKTWCGEGQRPEPTPAAAKKGLTQADMPLYEFDPEVWQALADDRDRWFRRSRKPLSVPTFTAHVRAAQRQAIRASEVDPETAPISPSKACGWCEFSHLCRAEIMGGRPEPLVLSDFGLAKRTKFGR